MKRLRLLVFLVLIAFTDLLGAVEAGRAPEFWYVVPPAGSGPAVTKAVRGIVVPSAATPEIRTTSSGTVIAWLRPDGKRQSFSIQGVSSISLRPGPIVGTIYIPFRRPKELQYDPGGCCACASFENSVESVESLSCVVGCLGCGCEGCICSPTFPCPIGPEGDLTLVAGSGVGPAMRFDEAGDRASVTMLNRGIASARFDGVHVTTRLDAHGITMIDDPDSITLTGPVLEHASTRGGKTLFAWTSAGADVILEQAATLPKPAFRNGTIDLATPGDDAVRSRRLAVEPVADRCKACGTHPNSVADLDIYDCVPGDSICYRCVSWEC